MVIHLPRLSIQGNPKTPCDEDRRMAEISRLLRRQTHRQNRRRTPTQSTPSSHAVTKWTYRSTHIPPRRYGLTAIGGTLRAFPRSQNQPAPRSIIGPFRTKQSRRPPPRPNGLRHRSVQRSPCMTRKQVSAPPPTRGLARRPTLTASLALQGGVGETCMLSQERRRTSEGEMAQPGCLACADLGRAAGMR